MPKITNNTSPWFIKTAASASRRIEMLFNSSSAVSSYFAQSDQAQRNVHILLPGAGIAPCLNSLITQLKAHYNRNTRFHFYINTDKECAERFHEFNQQQLNCSYHFFDSNLIELDDAIDGNVFFDVVVLEHPETTSLMGALSNLDADYRAAIPHMLQRTKEHALVILANYCFSEKNDTLALLENAGSDIVAATSDRRDFFSGYNCMSALHINTPNFAHRSRREDRTMLAKYHENNIRQHDWFYTKLLAVTTTLWLYTFTPIASKENSIWCSHMLFATLISMLGISSINRPDHVGIAAKSLASSVIATLFAYIVKNEVVDAMREMQSLSH